MGLYSGGLIIGRIFASVIWGAYFWEGTFFCGGGGGAYYLNVFLFLANEKLKILGDSGGRARGNLKWVWISFFSCLS